MNEKILNEFAIYYKRIIRIENYLKQQIHDKYTKGRLESIEHKLSIKSILDLIYENNPEYFNDDRILVNIFDDLAILLDYRTNNLPPYKSIIRAKFKVENNYTK